MTAKTRPFEAEAAFMERDRRYRAALARVQAATPKACPLCGDDDITPLFDGTGDTWDCGSCGNVWEVA